MHLTVNQAFARTSGVQVPPRALKERNMTIETDFRQLNRPIIPENIETRANFPWENNWETPDVTERLLELWLNGFESVCSLPTVNKERFDDLIKKAQTNNKTLVFIALGCQNWLIPDWGNPEENRIISLIGKDNKKAQRFATGLTSFQRALESFDVQTEIHFSLSDIEARLHLQLQNMGLTIHNSESALENQDKNIASIVELVKKAGGNIIPFSHSKLIEETLETRSLQEIQTLIAGHKNPTMREFLDGLYAFDLSQLVAHFTTPNKLGPVWLDIISINFQEDIHILRQLASRLAPDLPIIAPFKNGGNWHAKPVAESTFLTKKEMVSDELAIDSRLTKEDWLRQARGKPDQAIANLLAKLEFQMTINSSEDQVEALALLASTTFPGWDARPFLENKAIEQITIDQPVALQRLVQRISGKNSSETKHLILEGAVKVNEQTISDRWFVIGEPVKLQIGKRILVRVIFQN